MKKAIILVAVATGSELLVASMLNQIPNINYVHQVIGFFDIIAQVEAETHDQLRDVIKTKIKHMNHVRTILALIVKETDNKGIPEACTKFIHIPYLINRIRARNNEFLLTF